MNEQTYEGPKVEGSRQAGKTPGRDQPGSVMEPQAGQEEAGRGMQQRWEAQWQQFLKTLQAPHSAWKSLQLSEAAPWDDAKTFLASFEQVAAACRWPRAEWVARLLPALGGEAQQAFSLLAARDMEDYGKVRAAILRGEALRREAQRQQFRQFCCQELRDPRRMYSQLQELCYQWLKPERHTKEQILELLILEQFLASLPVDVQGWIWAGGPDDCAQAVALLEDFLMSRREANTGTWQEPLQEWDLGSLDVKEEPLDVVQGEISEEHAERFRDTKQYIDGEVALSGIGITRPTLLLPPEGQDMAEAELNQVLSNQVDQVTNSRKEGVPFHMVEQTPVQSSQCTMFWNVLPEGGENVDSLEASLGPRLGLDPHPVKKEETFFPDPVESPKLPDQESEGSLGPLLGLDPHPVKKEETFFPDPVESPKLPDQESDDGKRTQLKVKNSQLGGSQPVETPRRGWGKTQENLPVTAEVQADRYESKSREGTEPHMGYKDYGELTETLGDACSNPSTGDTEWKSLPLAEEIQSKSNLDKHHSSHMEDKNHDCQEFEVRLHFNSLAKDQVIQTEEKTYKSPDWRKTFSRRSNLLIQQMIHAGKKPHKCPVCGRGFSFRSELLRHQEIHSGEKPHKCPTCGKGFTVRYNLLTHQMTHTGKKPYQCPECGRKFYRKANLLNHQIIHTGEKPHKCPECGKGFIEKSGLINHQNIHTGEKLHKCPQCGKEFFHRSYLLRHQKIHSGEKPHKCPDCGKSFSRRSYVLRHQSIHCGKSFSEKSVLEKLHKCPDCGKEFFHSSQLSRHQKIHTGEKPYKCPDCGKDFSLRYNLLTHQVIHKGEKPHQCLECGRNFYRKANLLNHQIMHTGEKPHKCPECGRGFSHKSSLISHQKIHTGEKLYKCSDCGEDFYLKSDLLSHREIHTGEKPHKCLDCGKSFSHRSGLLRHQSIHTGEKPHTCLECGRSFAQKSSLLKHEKTHKRKKSSMS